MKINILMVNRLIENHSVYFLNHVNLCRINHLNQVQNSVRCLERSVLLRIRSFETYYFCVKNQSHLKSQFGVGVLRNRDCCLMLDEMSRN